MMDARDATPDAILSFVRASGKRVLTFAGYSDAGYDDAPAMLAAARAVLERHDPATTLVNIGATASGIGAVYALAREMGFATMGIVSSLAREQGAALSPAVDRVFFVRDATWGGIDAATGELSPTSAAIVAASDEIVAIGGGDIARDELLAARAAGKRTSFIAADIHHRNALARSTQRNEAPPTDFRGSVHRALLGGD